MSHLQANRRAYWQQHIERFQDSGLSGMEYCAREELTYHCFIYWRRKLMAVRDKDAATDAFPVARTSGFIAVQATAQAAPNTSVGLELALPNGLVIGNIQSENLEIVRPLLEQL